MKTVSVGEEVWDCNTLFLSRSIYPFLAVFALCITSHTFSTPRLIWLLDFTFTASDCDVGGCPKEIVHPLYI